MKIGSVILFALCADSPAIIDRYCPPQPHGNGSITRLGSPAESRRTGAVLQPIGGHRRRRPVLRSRPRFANPVTAGDIRGLPPAPDITKAGPEKDRLLSGRGRVDAGPVGWGDPAADDADFESESESAGAGDSGSPAVW